MKLGLLLWHLPSIFVASPLTTSGTRVVLLKLFGAKIGKGVVIKAAFFKEPWNLDIGANTWIGRNCDFDNPGQIKIGSNTCISQHCHIITGNHDIKSLDFRLVTHITRIGSNVWLQAGCRILGSAEIPDGSRLKAYSVVSGNYRLEKTNENKN